LLLDDEADQVLTMPLTILVADHVRIIGGYLVSQEGLLIQLEQRRIVMLRDA
jgi:hypothetical protein